MSETIEFEITHEYSPHDIGIKIDLELRKGDVCVNEAASVDTGATYCIFKRFLGEGLNLEIETGIPVMIGTVTGSFRAFGHELTLRVLGIEVVSTVYFAESEYFDRNVLGRIGWLDRVKLGLIEPEGKLFLSQYTQ